MKTSAPGASLRVAADIGGTFTDIASIDGTARSRRARCSSTPGDYAEGVLRGVDELGAAAAAADLGLQRSAACLHRRHQRHPRGQGRAHRAGDDRGFRDVLELRRIRVPRLYDPLYEKPPPLVPRRLRFEVSERLDARGERRARRSTSAAVAARRRRDLRAQRRRGGGGLLPALLRQPGARAARRRDPARGAARRLRLAVRRGPAGDPRVRAHQHDGRSTPMSGRRCARYLTVAAATSLRRAGRRRRGC